MEKNKNQQEILAKLGIEQLNEMQEAAHQAILEKPEVVLLSPTGSGKTLAFTLPLLAALDTSLDQVQILILVPSRELAIQIEQVIRTMGSGYKTNAVYGGRAGFKDRGELKHPPAILIGTPGRVADHIRNKTIATEGIKTLVLDEFDKSLEVGFEKEMKEIMEALPSIEKKILTSATQKAAIPEFVGLQHPTQLNFLSEGSSLLELKKVVSPTKDKLDTLCRLLEHVRPGRGIVFCSLKDTIQLVSDFLQKQDIDHTCFYGGMEQGDREKALIKFRNGTHRILIATDLAARGIDVPEIDFIIHYELPFKKEEFIHRNGRTARMHSEGTAYVIQGKGEKMTKFSDDPELEEINQKQEVSIPSSEWCTLYVAGGRRDKISKGDIAGLFFKQGGLNKEELGVIELKNDCAFVAVPTLQAQKLVHLLNNSKLKKKKVRISILD